MKVQKKVKKLPEIMVINMLLYSEEFLIKLEIQIPIKLHDYFILLQLLHNKCIQRNNVAIYALLVQ